MSKILKKSVLVFLALTIAITTAISVAKGKVFSIKKGQTAPFEGTLFDLQASADITVRLENHKAQCDLKLQREKEELDTICEEPKEESSSNLKQLVDGYSQISQKLKRAVSVHSRWPWSTG